MENVPKKISTGFLITISLLFGVAIGGVFGFYTLFDYINNSSPVAVQTVDTVVTAEAGSPLDLAIKLGQSLNPTELEILPQTGSEETITILKSCIVTTKPTEVVPTKTPIVTATSTPKASVTSTPIAQVTTLKFAYAPSDPTLKVGKTYDFDIVVDPKFAVNEKSIMGGTFTFTFDSNMVAISAPILKTSSPFESWGLPQNTSNGRFESSGMTKGFFNGTVLTTKSITTSFTLRPLKPGTVNLKFNNSSIPITGTNKAYPATQLVGFNNAREGVNIFSSNVDASFTAVQ